MSRLRVAHVGTYHRDSADGTEKTVAGLVTWLPEYGVDVEVWQPVHGARSVRERQVDGVRVWELPAYAAPSNFFRGVPPETVAFVRSRQQQVDVLHLHSGLVPEHVAIAAEVRVPYVIAPNGIYSPANLRGRNGWFKQSWLRLREAGYVQRAALLHAVSQGEHDELGRQFPGVPLTLVHNAVDVPSMPPLAAVEGDESPGRHLVFLGRLAVEQKGLDLLVRGYRLLLDRTDHRSIRLVFVGPDHRGGRLELEKLVHALRLDAQVEFRAPVFGADKWRLLAGAFALVHPSRWDGLPFTLLEALAARRPVLVTPGTNLSGLVASYAAGVVVAPEATDVARGLEALVGLAPQPRAAMGRNGLRLVQDHFTWPEAARRMAGAYRGI